MNKTFLNFKAPNKLNKTFLYSKKPPIGETTCLSNHCYLLAAQAFSFLVHPLSQTVSQDTYPSLDTLSLTVQNLCDLQDAMLRHWSLSTYHPTLPRKAEIFPNGGKYPKDVPLLTFLAYLQPI